MRIRDNIEQTIKFLTWSPVSSTLHDSYRARQYLLYYHTVTSESTISYLLRRPTHCPTYNIISTVVNNTALSIQHGLQYLTDKAIHSRPVDSISFPMTSAELVACNRYGRPFYFRLSFKRLRARIGLIRNGVGPVAKRA